MNRKNCIPELPKQKSSNIHLFCRLCITKALIAAVKGDMQNGLVFCGANVGRINRMTTVHELMSELVGA